MEGLGGLSTVFKLVIHTVQLQLNECCTLRLVSKQARNLIRRHQPEFAKSISVDSCARCVYSKIHSFQWWIPPKETMVFPEMCTMCYEKSPKMFYVLGDLHENFHAAMTYCEHMGFPFVISGPLNNYKAVFLKHDMRQFIKDTKPFVQKRKKRKNS